MSARVDPSDRKALLKQALAAVDQMQAKLEASERSRNEPIAIVGLACRFPGAESPEALWRVLRAGEDAVSDVPADRWDVDRFYDPEAGAPGKMVTRRGGFLSRVDLFDPQFFGISPREAASMDPQQRLLLEATWEALEHAGQAPDALVGSQTGVFIGITTSDYAHLVGVGSADQCDVYAATGNALNAAAGRLAFVLGLQGPCVAVDTACSSSLVAIHQACQSLRVGESAMAIAGGVNVVLRPEAAILFSKWGMLAPDGRCKTFDAAADGFVRGEGCGIVVLKRLSDAAANGDRVLAIIRGSATNQDGRSSGLTVPNGPAQQAVVRRALKTAGIEPSAVDYVETHGTGTPIGDPIEVEALAAEFGPGRPPDRPLLLGSIKTNIGHTEAASGVAGLIKVVLSLQHQEIPPHLHLQQLNPRIAWERMPLAVPTSLTPWPAGSRPRIAGVSSFGFSGTNAHLVVEEAPEAAPANGGDRPRHLLTLSARSRPALAQLAGRLAAHVARETGESLADICFTAATGRAQLPHRIALPASSRDELVQSLQGFADGSGTVRLSGEARRGNAVKVAFLFTGQGSQYAGMARELYETHPTFRAVVDRCEALLGPATDRPLTSVLFPEHGGDGAIDATAWTQPALFAVEYALASLWREWGIEPAVVMGHSLGEYVAATVAGVFTLEEALTLVAARGRLMQALPAGGAMAAVFAAEARVAAALRPYARSVAMAAVNAPEEVVISGDGNAVRALCASLGDEGIRTKPLTVSHAFHSPLMDPMLDEFERIAGAIPPRAPRVPLVANVTGRLVSAGEPLDASYWRRHVRQPVRFLDSVRAVHAKGIEIFLEVGPSPILGGMTRQILESTGLRVFASLRKGRGGWQTMLEAVGGLYVEGVPIDWRGFDKPFARQRIALPTYPFQRERHWIDTRKVSIDDQAPGAGSRLPGVGVRSASSGDVVFQAVVSASSEPFLADHAVFGNVIFPAAGYVSVALAAAEQLGPEHAREVVDLGLHDAMLFRDGEGRHIQTILSPSNEAGAYRFAIYSAARSEQPPTQWTRHASGEVRGLAREEDRVRPSQRVPVLDLVAGRCSSPLPPTVFYGRLEDSGIQFGPSYRRLRALDVGVREAVGRIDADGVVGALPIHPAVIDAVFQVLGAAAAPELSASQRDDTLLPVGIRRFCQWGSLPLRGDLRIVAEIAEPQTPHPDTMIGDMWCFDADGTLVISIEGFSAKRVSRAALLRSRPGRTDEWLYEMAWRPAEAAAGRPGAPGHWLVLADRSGVGARLAAAITDVGGTSTVVRAGSGFAEDADGFTVDPSERGDCARLLSAVISRSGGAPAGVAHLWNLDLAASDELPAGWLDASVGSLLPLSQAIVDATGSRPGRLVIVTRAAQPAEGAGASVNPLQAPAWGFARTLVAEHPELACRLIDLEAGGRTLNQDVAQLLAELIGAARGESEIAYRSGVRLTPRLIRSSSAASAVSAGVHFEADATYLITGGVGGLGLTVAHWMVQQGARHLTLVSRSGASADAQVAIASLEQAGATVTLATADVASRAQLTEVFAGIPTVRPLRGIVHAAGCLDDGVVGQLTRARLEQVMAPKVQGAWNLHRLSQHTALDFFALFSSASSVFGSPGQSNYAAGNAFLDALSHHRRTRSLPCISINWGAWSDVGMAARLGARERDRLAASGLTPIDPAGGVEALKTAFQRDRAQLIVMPVDWPAFARQYVGSSVPPLVSELVLKASSAARPVDRGPSVDFQTQLLACDSQGRTDLTTAYVAAQIGAVLGLNGVAIDGRQPLTALGLDSLMAVELKNRFDADLGVAVPLVQLLQGTPDEITAYLLSGLEEVPAKDAEDGTASAVAAGSAELLARLPQMSESEMDALLERLHAM